ncbi:uridine kinase [Arcanobacterium hippocoleae]|uniref:Uridine kinase n=1 Tax=Arcanobacterium hippocoleae TaxID=149017 RepID=A0ABU1T480_9ACTO|nr:uridine kinase [Arcanobacterium hippocoleae]MDR6940025.1 uridine kinase [Arcanobacterium hippocoleae]
MRPLIIGIAGGTGSGKSTLTNALKTHFGQQAAVVYHDNYYRAQDDLSYEERTKINYDAPDAFDNDLLITDLRLLIAGTPIMCPVYDFARHTRSDERQEVLPAPVILVEGILIFTQPQLCDLFDLKLFVDTDADVRILRRMSRDVAERGRTIESVQAQYLATVKPMHEMYVEPSKKLADVIIPEGGQNQAALQMITHHIATMIARRIS